MLGVTDPSFFLFNSFVDYLSSDSEAGEDPIPDITKLKLSHDEVINKTSFKEGYFVTPGAHHFHDSVVDDSMDTDPTNQSQDGTTLNQHYRRQARFTFATILDIIQGAIGGFMNYEAFVNNNENINDEEDEETTPTIAGVAKRLASKHKKVLDKKQYITYEIICCSFLLSILHDTTDPTSDIYRHIDRANSSDNGKIYILFSQRKTCINLIQMMSLIPHTFTRYYTL